jgi:uncharacterized coiled-coil DUF342 family protein
VTQTIDADATVAALHERLTGLRAELDATRNARDAAQVKAANGMEGAQAEADRLDGEVQRLERSIATTDEALAAVDRATAEIATEAEQAQAKRDRDRLKSRAQRLRPALKALDDAADELVKAFADVRERISEMFLAADGPTRNTDEFQSLQYLVPSIPAVILARLAFSDDRLPAPNIAIDREAPCPSALERFEPVLSLIAPGPGRPKRAGADPAEDAARAAIEKDIAA